jgi:RimJ/RimL family protein N-acetyltransferase
VAGQSAARNVYHATLAGGQGDLGFPEARAPGEGETAKRATKMTELETERLRLRQCRPTDIEHFAVFFADEEMARYVGGACDRDDAWRRMAVIVGHWTLRGYGMWALEEKATGAFAGCAGLWFSDGWPELELGWWLMRNMQGRGYATEAALRTRHYAYDVLGADTLVSYIDPDNAASKRVAERLGAAFEGIIQLNGQPACAYRHPAPSWP